MALRLFKEGSVHHSTILEYPKVWEEDEFYIYPHREEPIFGLSYVLTNDVEKFKEFWSKFKSLNIEQIVQTPHLGLAIVYFNLYYERGLPRLSDASLNFTILNRTKLIDLIIAFEALFIKGKEESRKKCNIARRCAYFLGKDKEEREKIIDNLIKAYNMRNEIVHGEDVRSKLLSYLRVIEMDLKRFLDEVQTKSYEDIIEEIKDKMDKDEQQCKEWKNSV